MSRRIVLSSSSEYSESVSSPDSGIDPNPDQSSSDGEYESSFINDEEEEAFSEVETGNETTEVSSEESESYPSSEPSPINPKNLNRLKVHRKNGWTLEESPISKLASDFIALGTGPPRRIAVASTSKPPRSRRIVYTSEEDEAEPSSPLKESSDSSDYEPSAKRMKYDPKESSSESEGPAKKPEWDLPKKNGFYICSQDITDD